jgi:hypothetical protein
MNIDPTAILQTITLAVSGWTLLEVIRMGRKIERHDQKLSDLPCNNCPFPKPQSKQSYEY